MSQLPAGKLPESGGPEAIPVLSDHEEEVTFEDPSDNNSSDDSSFELAIPIREPTDEDIISLFFEYVPAHTSSMGNGPMSLTNNSPFQPDGQPAFFSTANAEEPDEDSHIDTMDTQLQSLLNTAPESEKISKELQFIAFTRLFRRFLNDSGPSIDWDKIKPLPLASIIEYELLHEGSNDRISEMLNKLVVVKLNGGLGTSMGCRGPKSIIPVKRDYTFLDLTVLQIAELNQKYDVSVPLVLMNSFNTDTDTKKIISKYKELNVNIHTFNQSCFPRVSKESLEPIATSCDVENNKEGWYPPGHGDFYDSFKNSGLLEKFINDGKEFCFVSNVDNLGATVDLSILNLLFGTNNRELEFVIELTKKTKADVKGGTLVQYENKLRLLEFAQVPKEHLEEFKSVRKFKLFNTNNLWIKLEAIDRILNNGSMDLEIIVNNKTLDNDSNIIQLETAVGAAMELFDCGVGINVPRSRFLPVKKTSDLLLVMSDLYGVRDGALVMNPNRMFSTTPSVKLDDEHFSKVNNFLSRFETIPSIIELDHLTVSGDVTFGRNVSLKGTVIIIANHGSRINIPSNSVFENHIVSGDLRILDH